MVVPYINGLGECSKNICNKMGIHMNFKGGNTIRSFLVAPKGKVTITKKMGKSTGISMTKWSVIVSTLASVQDLWERLEEQFRAPSPFMSIPTSHH